MAFFNLNDTLRVDVGEGEPRLTVKRQELLPWGYVTHRVETVSLVEPSMRIAAYRQENESPEEP